MHCNPGTADTLLYAVYYLNCRRHFVCSALLELSIPFSIVQNWKCRHPFVCGAILELPKHFCMQCNSETANNAELNGITCVCLLSRHMLQATHFKTAESLFVFSVLYPRGSVFSQARQHGYQLWLNTPKSQ
jgi:hypothetical protein